MASNNSRKTKLLAISAMLSALSVVILYLGSVFNMFDLTAVAIVSILMIFAVEEIKSPYTYAIYGVTGVLSMLLLPDKFASVTFILVGGVYPLFRPKLEKLPKLLSFVIKFVYFNAVLSALIAVTMFVLGIEDDRLGFNILTYVLSNAVFFLYDYFVTLLSQLYGRVLRKRLGVNKLMK